MGSIVMHLCISNKIKNKYNFSDNFLVGSILPDIYKKTIMTRDESHYLIEEVIDNNSIVCVPDIERYMRENKKNNKDEVTLGYLAHLVEDYIWFKYYSAIYVIYCGKDKNGVEKYRYKKENYKVLHGEKHFLKRIYGDYSYFDKVLSNEEKIDLEKIKKLTCKYLKNDEKSNKVVEDMVRIHEVEGVNKTYFITKEDIDDYIDMTLKMIEEVLNKFMKD